MVGGSNKLLTAQEVADMLRVTRDYIYRNWRIMGLRAYRVGGRLVFRERHVESWLEAQEIRIA